MSRTLIPLGYICGIYGEGEGGKGSFGTLTYYDPHSGISAAYAHALSGTQVQLHSSGVRVYGWTPGVPDRRSKGTGGGVGGSFNANELLGVITKDTRTGIFGLLDVSRWELPRPTQTAEPGEAQNGAALMLSGITGKVEAYQVGIERATKFGFHIRVNDSRLLRLVNGIVRGMSGSPIIQNGLFVGALSHCDGGCVHIENMLKAADEPPFSPAQQEKKVRLMRERAAERNIARTGGSHEKKESPDSREENA